MHPDLMTYCELCGEPLSHGDPGAVYIIYTDRYPNGTDVALHDQDCRHDWFTDQRTITRFHVDHRVEDVI